MKTDRFTPPIVLATILLCSGPTRSAPIVSDGSDGAFHPTTSERLILNDVAPNGVFNFTTIDIPAGVTITFERNSLNTPVFFAATGDVTIDGVIDVSGHHFSRTGGPGGWDGGLHSPNSAGDPGYGPGAGLGGNPPAGQGNGGGGGGMATTGGTAVSRTGSAPGSGGVWVPRPELVPNQTGGGGSGGGGGGGRLFYTTNMTGGDGGGAGGGLQISTPGTITINGRLKANGGHGAWAFRNVFAHGGPGGGGSGGNIELFSNGLALGDTCVIEARGGAGGGLSTEPVPNDPYTFSSGANGGLGYLHLEFSSLTVGPNTDLVVNVDPQPTIVEVNRDDASGHVWLDCRGLPGLEYTLQGSTDLVTWGDRTSITAAADGHFDWTDESVTTDLAYYYRITRP